VLIRLWIVRHLIHLFIMEQSTDDWASSRGDF
jgi:hypothetical protein